MYFIIIIILYLREVKTIISSYQVNECLLLYPFRMIFLFNRTCDEPFLPFESSFFQPMFLFFTDRLFIYPFIHTFIHIIIRLFVCFYVKYHVF